jgi:hypothetical protein
LNSIHAQSHFLFLTKQEPSILLALACLLVAGCAPPKQKSVAEEPQPTLLTMESAILIATAKFKEEIPERFPEYRVYQVRDGNLFWEIVFELPVPVPHTEISYVVDKSDGYVERFKRYSRDRGGSERLIKLMESGYSMPKPPSSPR